MRIGVLGFGHFAHVVAHCLRFKGHDVLQYDDSPFLVRHGQPLERGTESTVLARPSELKTCEVLWAAYDVPLNEQGRGRDDLVLGRISAMLTLYAEHDPLVLLSSQWQVGTTKELELKFPRLTFVYVMENVRVGRAVADFLGQPYIVAGYRDPEGTGPTVREIFRDIARVFSMNTESAEMTKHALNSQIALQIAWGNEIARISALVGAEPVDVIAGVKTDPRVSPSAPINPGGPFGGGSLKRDVLTLCDLSGWDAWTPIIKAINPSNEGRPRLS